MNLRIARLDSTIKLEQILKLANPQVFHRNPQLIQVNFPK